MRHSRLLLLGLAWLAAPAFAADAVQEEVESEAGAPLKTAQESKPPPAETPPPPDNAIRLRGLNKVTARIETLEAPLGTVMRFGALEIIAHRCWRSPPEDRPESAGLLEIWENRPGEGTQKLFSGWMFASSPALSALEHPVYDVTVIACSHLTLEE